ncbi:DUF6492 family protein [Oscillatoria salina]|uniref:DUF6492 family protein n=1 Tax=Oscillatoria salina TaxID=331517 RepID=UPI001CCF37FC|nr:DUF6492 family protein [Oscillatoria salina]MBZ8179107.1 hypothetical protein [Oscillatoria salina IIICB1]
MNDKQVTFGIITPSYAPDFERCKLLCESVDKFISPAVKHYLIVDRRDLQLFRQLENSHTELLAVEDILPWWIQRVPFLKKAWLSLKTMPLRNWLVQQIVKIATGQEIAEDVAVFVDSDVVFVRPFDFQTFVRDDGKVRFYREPKGNEIQKKVHLKWHQSASNLLGLPDVDLTIPDYIGNAITWKKENVVKLCKHLESVSGRGWIETLANTYNLSEYVLYGIFVERILQSESGHYNRAENLCNDYWYPEALDDEKLSQLIKKTAPEQVALMITAKAGMPVERYKPLLEKEFSF